jgi:hypothetical protein
MLRHISTQYFSKTAFSRAHKKEKGGLSRQFLLKR